MTKIVWDKDGERTYESGTDRGVFYIRNTEEQELTDHYKYGVGEAWNGITAFTSSPSGAEVTKLWADNRVYASMTSAEEYGATIEAYTYPDSFANCDGSRVISGGIFVGQQNRKKFAFAVRTMKGNDTEGYDHGYILHLIWNCTAGTTERSYATQNDSPEAITFSWEINTEPVTVNSKDEDGNEMKPTAHIEIDTTMLNAAGKDTLQNLEDMLYGTASTEPRFPDDPDYVINLFRNGGGESGGESGAPESGSEEENGVG